MKIEEELSKMQADIDLLKSQISKQQSEAKPSLVSMLFDRTNKTIPVLLAATSLLAAIWGLILPVKNYFNERQKQLRYELSREMLDLAHDLRNDSVLTTRQDAVLLLSYYDLNSMPILLYQLENFSNSAQRKMVEHVIKSISLIYMRNEKEVTSEIINYFTSLFKQTNTVDRWDAGKYNSLLNYGELVTKMSFRDRDRKRIAQMIQAMQSEIQADPDLADKMKGFVRLLDEF